MNVYAREIGLSLTVCSLGAILFSVCCCLDYYVDKTMLIVVHVLFWVGLAIFLVGLLPLVRVLARRTEFRGITLSRGPPPAPAPHTSVTVMSTGVVYQRELAQPGILQPGHQYQQAWPGQPTQSMPAYSIPAQSMPAYSMPAQSMPAYSMPAQSMPAQPPAYDQISTK